MDVTTFKNKIDEHLVQHSGLDPKRDYLGISQIGKCPRQVVKDFLYGTGDVSLQAHEMCYAGYLFEQDVMRRLHEIGVANIPALVGQQQAEVIAPFDARLRGHVDGETLEGDLLEVKSLSRAKFEKVKQSHMALTGHFAQVQLYMKYGSWKKCWIVYVCRETMEHHVVKVPYLHTSAVKYEIKAQRILSFIDSGILPACECRYCKE